MSICLLLASCAVTLVSVRSDITSGPTLLLQHFGQALVASVGGRGRGQVEQVVLVPGRLVHGLGADGLGIITSQTDDELTLKLPGGISIAYKTADIAKRTQLPISIMPPGLQATMTPQELVDMITYLHSLKQAKP